MKKNEAAEGIQDPRYQFAYAFIDHIFGSYEVALDNRMTLESTKNAVGTCHTSLMEYNNEWYLIYHRLAEPETSVLRETCMGLVHFKDGKPYVDVDE